MDFQKVVAERRSIRAYKDTPVSEEKLKRVLEAARLAPSAANRQPWKLYVVRDEATKRKLGESYRNAWFYEAPVIIVITTVPDRSWKRSDGKNYADVDAAIAFEHLVLAAHAEGLGTCWIGAFNPPVVSSVLGLPPGEEPLAMTPLGEPAKAANPTPRKPLEDLVKFV